MPSSLSGDSTIFLLLNKLRLKYQLREQSVKNILNLVKEMTKRGYGELITKKTVRWDMILQIRDDVKERVKAKELAEIRAQSLGAAFQTPPVVVGPAASSMDTSESTKRKSSNP